MTRPRSPWSPPWLDGLAPRVATFLTIALLPLGLAILWEAAVRFGFAEGRLMPPPSRVLATLAETGWPAEQTVVEVTESLVEAESTRSVLALHVLREHGLQVAIDDFGTGYSALSRLDTLPTDYLKLDNSFVSAITTSSRRPRRIAAFVGECTPPST